jgi:dethiobiotin synthetase
MKPIETGCLREGDILVPSDGIFIKTVAHMEENIGHITPCCYESPLAPLPASRREGRPVDLDKIQKVFKALAKNYDIVIVEGIGGLLVPVRRDYFVLDLARDFGLPVVVVARPDLGTINHTMLTVNYAVREGLDVAGIIINYSRPPESTIAEITNPEILREISPVPVIGIFPYLRDFEDSTVQKAVVKNLNIEILKKYL